MKKLFFTFLTSISLISFGQVPQEISYQGVARNTTGSVLPNQNIGIKLDLHQGSAAGTIVFSETHNKTTNAFGLFTLGIGSSNTSGFTSINWANGPYFLEVSMDPAGGISYTSVGTQQFMSVPYALYAQTSGNASVTPTITINAPNTVTSAGGSYSITVPSQTLSLNSNSLSISNGNTVVLPTGTTYTAGQGVDITGGVISGTANITGTGATTVTGTYPNLVVSSPTVTNYTAGNGIDITNGVISNTATNSPTLTGLGLGSATVTTSGTSFTVNTPAQQVYSAGNGIGITGGIISNTLTPVTPTLSVSGNNITITPGNTQALPNYSLTQSGANIDLTQNGTSIATVTLTAATSTSLSAGSSNIILNQAGNAYTITPVTPTFTNAGSTTITGSYPNYTVNSVASPSTTLIQGSNVTLNQSGSTYTVNAAPYTLSSNSNTLTLTNGTVVSTATVPVQSAYVGTANNITVTSNTINLATTAITAGTYGVNASNAVPTFSVDNFGRLTSANQYTPTVSGDVIGSINTSTVSKLRGVNISATTPAVGQVLQFNAGSWTPTTMAASVITGTGTGIATVTTALTNFTVNVPVPTYTPTTGALVFGTNTIIVTPTLSLTGTTLTSGASTNSVNLATLPSLWTAPTATSVVTTNSISLVGIGTNTPSYKLDVYANGSIPATIHGYNSGATASSTGVFGENPNNGIGVFGQSNSGKGVWGSSTSDAGIYGESVSGDGGKFILSSSTTSANAVNAQTNGTGAALYAKSYNANPLAAKFDGNVIVNHTSTPASPHVTLVSPTISDFGRFKFLNTGSVNYFSLEGRNNSGGVNDAFDISHYNGVNEKQIFLINGTRNVFINNLNVPLATFHVMTSTATASGGIASEGFGQSGQLNLTRNNNAGAGGRTSVFGGDELGKLNFAGYDGSTFGDGAQIYAKATENVTGATKGTELVFAAVPSGSSINVDVFKINGANKVEVITGLYIPTNPGNGKVLTSDAIGNASWQLPSVPAAAWTSTLGNTFLVNSTDKVGIGTSTPNSPFQVLNYVSFENNGSNTSLGFNTGGGTSPNNYYNTFVGANAGQQVGTGTGNSNSFLGYHAGQNTVNGFANTFMGTLAGAANNVGSNNSFFGSGAGQSNNTGINNVFIGANAGTSNTSAQNNTFIGNGADLSSAVQYTNATAIGYNTKVNDDNTIALGNNSNVIIGGAKAGIITGASRYLTVANTTAYSPGTNTSLELQGYTNSGNSSAARIDFINGLTPTAIARVEAITSAGSTVQGALRFFTNAGTLTEAMRITPTGSVGIGTTTPGGLFELSLDQGRKPGSTAWTITSDERLKNIEGNYTKGLAEILQLQPISYHYKNTDDRKFADEVTKTLYAGFSAQEVQKIFPEAVGIDADGYLNLNVHAILIAYTNAIKELNAKNEEQQKTIEQQKSLIESLGQKFDQRLKALEEMQKKTTK